MSFTGKRYEFRSSDMQYRHNGVAYSKKKGNLTDEVVEDIIRKTPDILNSTFKKTAEFSAYEAEELEKVKKQREENLKTKRATNVKNADNKAVK